MTNLHIFFFLVFEVKLIVLFVTDSFFSLVINDITQVSLSLSLFFSFSLFSTISSPTNLTCSSVTSPSERNSSSSSPTTSSNRSSPEITTNLQLSPNLTSESPDSLEEVHSTSTTSSLSSLQSQNHSTVSSDGKIQLQIITQPEQQHRARYQTEGSRGAVKDKSGNGFPVVKLNGYSKPAILQV